MSVGAGHAETRRSSLSSPRAIQWLAGLLLLAASVACLVSPFLALHRARQPFPGFLLEPTMVISGVGRSSWPGHRVGLTHPWRVVAADGIPMSDPSELDDYLADLPIGTEVTYTVENVQGQQQTYSVPSSLLPRVDLTLLFWIPYFSALTYLVCAISVYWTRRVDLAGLSCAILCSAVALSLVLLYNAFSGHILTHLWTASLALSAAAGLQLSLIFPAPSPPVRRIPWASWLPYALAAGLIVWTEWAYRASDPLAYTTPWRWTFLSICLSILFFLGSLTLNWRVNRDRRIRQQARSVLLGSLLAFLPTAIGFGVAHLRLEFNPYLPMISISLAVFPFTMAYAIARKSLLSLDRVGSRTLAYSLMALLLAGLYMAVVGLIGWLAPGLLRADDPISLAFIVIVAAFLATPVQRRLRQWVDRLLYRDRFNFRRVVQEFSHSLAQVIDLSELSHRILQRIADILHLDAASLYLFDPRNGTYTLFEATGAADLRDAPVFAETDPFIEHLRAADRAVYRHYQGIWLRDLPSEEKARVNRLRALVFLPLTAKTHLVGWLNLGARLSGEGYSGEDLELLNALADRAAVAIENARLFAERERRLTELAVLNEIGQAISSALSLDQVLEQIYRETSRLMDTTNFYIALHDPTRQEVTFPIAVQDGERRFPRPRSSGNGLTEYLIRTGQPLLIADRVEERIRSLGLEVIGRPASSWLGVPILHERQPVGVIAVQSAHHDITYDVQDLEILSAIANQAAIAIENARLYEMTDHALSRRLEEITVLAEFANTLATVTLDPAQVAEQTLCRAAETLHATMGILVRYHEQERCFTPLARLRWPATEGWSEVWQSVLPHLLTASPRTLLYGAAELETLVPAIEAAPLQLLCPLMREDTLLAILHLALPTEAEPDPDRRRFLRHLADHAAIALESALLYQQQVQQREALDSRARHLAEVLNLGNVLRANMELDQVLQTVVEAARDSLGFQIAVLSMVEEEKTSRMRRVAAVGFPEDALHQFQTVHPPLSFYHQIMQPQFRIGNTYLIHPKNAAVWSQLREVQKTYLPGIEVYGEQAWDQSSALLVPLRGTSDRLLGFLSVANPMTLDLPDQQTIEILEIFANQAAVAIENTRLYQALREAYDAKGEFLDLVAHELQVPMGTLWGYAELLESAHTDVDLDAMRGFMRVLKGNIARLDALVRDLLEISRIEAGRLRLNLNPLDPREVILDSVASHRPQIERKGLSLELNLPEGLAPIMADRDRLGQVMDNLISNASKYTPAPGTIALSAHVLQQIDELNGAGPEGTVPSCPCLLISIRDTGIGISRQEQKRLFTRFFRANHPLVYAEGGTGLGLYIVHLLVEAHQGQIWVDSEPERGSTFFVAIPLAGTGESNAQSEQP